MAADAPTLAGKIWQARRDFELAAAARFAHLHRALTDLGGSDAVRQLCERATHDELRHARQCAELAAHFGNPLQRAGAASYKRVAPAGLSPREALLYEIVAMSCITESLSTALLGSMVEQASDARAKTTMRAILRDEVNHARLGWAHLSAEHKRGARNVISDYLPAMLATTVEEELFFRGAEHPLQEQLSGLGGLSRCDRLALFCATMDKVVFPGLERFDIDTLAGRNWLQQKVGASAEHN